MPSASFAEWILACFIGRTKASSIVGDLLETTQHRGVLWFWFSFASVFVSSFWRSLLGYVAGYFLAEYSLRVLDASIHNIYAAHQPLLKEGMVLSILQLFAVIACVNSAYSLFRFGFRDYFAQLSAVFSAIITMCVYYWWLRPVTIPCLVALTLVTLASLFTARRNALIAFASSVGLGLPGWLLLVVFGNVLHQHDQNASVLIYLLTASTDFVTVWVAVLACSRMHYIFLE